ncbi:MAG TPA: 6-phosphogluconolactonase [Candidatus Elarobacter sp.]|nr:6-phosphogluconolactonase [Candidatus Elarobacter sp.]HEV2739609.1 6-phosphogluconolactonase [Candidatus Elarobacter sp.]
MADAKVVTVLPDAAALAAAAADHVVDVLRAALAQRDIAHVALAGGSTPRAVNALLVAEPRRGEVDWSRVVFWFGDERCVPPDDEQSNYKMNRNTLLDPLGITPAQVHRMRGEDDPSAAAADYDVVLKRELGDDARLDLILLGMGPDGHTASLFPGTTADIDKDKLCIARYVPKLDMWRMTLTPRAINAAHNVAITAGGAEKADALREVLEGPKQTDVYPAQLVHPTHGELRWFVDAAAASKL